MGILSSCEPICDPIPGTPSNVPLGVCHGIKPGRVTWAWEPNACSWDGKTGRWWNNSNIDIKTVSGMFERTLIGITGEKTVSTAWKTLIEDVNTRFYREPKGRGYKRGDGLVIKVNLNGMLGSYEDNDGNGLSPQFLHSVLSSIVNVAGIPQEDIAVYDASRWFVNFLFEPNHASFPRIRFIDNAGQKSREKAVFDEFSHSAVVELMRTLV